MPVGMLGRIVTGMLITLFGYLVIGNLFHHAIFPLPAPDPATYPRVGDILVSRAEGFVQTVTGVDGEWLIGELVIEPNAPSTPVTV